MQGMGTAVADTTLKVGHVKTVWGEADTKGPEEKKAEEKPSTAATSHYNQNNMANTVSSMSSN